MNRIQAATAGERFFDSSKPCKKDGTTRRYTCSGGCVACEKKRAAGVYRNIRDLMAAAKAGPN